jgi:ZIP family zinc transporter
MVFISFVEFLRVSIMNIGFLYANIGFFAGVIFIYIIDLLVPHVYENEGDVRKELDMKKMSKMVALGIAIHNFPEGIAVLFSSLSDIKLGVLVAIAIALHNIPEGICVSVPMYYSEKSRKKALWYSFLSGMAEPLGAILALVLFYPFINTFTLNLMFAVVAGIMVFISFDELLPGCFECKDPHLSILGLFLGMFVMSIGLYISY